MRPPEHVLIFDRAGMRAVDRTVIQDLGLPGLVLMEQASAGIVDRMLRATAPEHVVIACGPGNNGGDGYAIARILTVRGLRVTLVAPFTPRPGTDAAVMAAVASRMGLRITREARGLKDADLIVDAVLGTGLDRPVSDELGSLIDAINDAPTPVVSVDLPSGLDADSGQPRGAAVRASLTTTLVGWKKGFLAPGVSSFTGAIDVVELDIPPEITRPLALGDPPGEL